MIQNKMYGTSLLFTVILVLGQLPTVQAEECSTTPSACRTEERCQAAGYQWSLVGLGECLLVNCDNSADQCLDSATCLAAGHFWNPSDSGSCEAIACENTPELCPDLESCGAAGFDWRSNGEVEDQTCGVLNCSAEFADCLSQDECLGAGYFWDADAAGDGACELVSCGNTAGECRNSITCQNAGHFWEWQSRQCLPLACENTPMSCLTESDCRENNHSWVALPFQICVDMAGCDDFNLNSDRQNSLCNVDRIGCELNGFQWDADGEVCSAPEFVETAVDACGHDELAVDQACEQISMTLRVNESDESVVVVEPSEPLQITATMNSRHDDQIGKFWFSWFQVVPEIENIFFFTPKLSDLAGEAQVIGAIDFVDQDDFVSRINKKKEITPTRMRMSNFDVPREIINSADFDGYAGLPEGTWAFCLNATSDTVGLDFEFGSLACVTVLSELASEVPPPTGDGRVDGQSGSTTGVGSTLQGDKNGSDDDFFDEVGDALEDVGDAVDKVVDQLEDIF